jgi:hypothetical protein
VPCGRRPRGSGSGGPRSRGTASACRTRPQSAIYTTPLNGTTERDRPPIIGRNGLLNLLDVVAKLRAAAASGSEGGASPWGADRTLPFPPASGRAVAAGLGAGAGAEPAPGGAVVESVSGAPARGGEEPERGGAR